MIYIDAIAYQSRFSASRTKIRLSLMLIGIVGSVLVDSAILYLVLFLFSFVSIKYLTRQSMGVLVKIMIVPLVFVLLSSLLVALTLSGERPVEAYFHLNILNMHLFVSEASFHQGLSVLNRSISTVVQAFSISLTIPVQQVIAWMHWVRIPKAFVQLFTLTYRMIFVVAEEAQALLQAQTLRFGFTKPTAIFHTMTALGRTLFMRTFSRLDDMEIAMDLRFFNAS